MLVHVEYKSNLEIISSRLKFVHIKSKYVVIRKSACLLKLQLSMRRRDIYALANADLISNHPTHREKSCRTELKFNSVFQNN